MFLESFHASCTTVRSCHTSYYLFRLKIEEILIEFYKNGTLKCETIHVIILLYLGRNTKKVRFFKFFKENIHEFYKFLRYFMFVSSAFLIKN